MDTIKIGQYIAYKRKQRGFTQKELADTLSVTNKAVSKWETGASLPDISILMELATVFDISVDELLKGEDTVFTKEKEKQTQHTFLVTKQVIKEVVSNWLFHKRVALTILYIFVVLLVFGGYALFALHRFFPTYPMNIVGIFAMLCGVLLFLLPFLFVFLKVISFKEREYQYEYTMDGIKYNKEGKETEYKYTHIQYCIEAKQYYILINAKEYLYIQKEDYQYIKKYLSCPKETFVSKYSKRVSIVTAFLVCLAILVLCLELGYRVVLTKFGFEMIFEQLEYTMIAMLVIFPIICILINKKKMHKKSGIFTFLTCFLLLLASWMIGDKQVINKTYFSWSKDLSTKLVLKQDKDTGKVKNYHDTYLCFATPTDAFDALKESGITTKWINTDCNYVTYRKPNGVKGVYVATFGDRGNGISYYSVLGSLQGEWVTKNNRDQDYHMTVENGAIVIQKGTEKEIFNSSEAKQFGTLAITLSKGSTVQYVIALNENCQINENGLIKRGGTIEIIPVYLAEATPTELFCTTYKEDTMVQRDIEDERKEEALEIINTLQELKADQKKYEAFTSNQSMFKIETDSTEYEEIVGLAYQKEESMHGSTGVNVESHGKTLSVKAGSIDEFYVEFTTQGTYTMNLESETSSIEYKYRVVKTSDGYLVAKIPALLPGDIGLVAMSPTIDIDISQNTLFDYIGD